MLALIQSSIFAMVSETNDCTSKGSKLYTSNGFEIGVIISRMFK